MCKSLNQSIFEKLLFQIFLFVIVLNLEAILPSEDGILPWFDWLIGGVFEKLFEILGHVLIAKLFSRNTVELFSKTVPRPCHTWNTENIGVFVSGNCFCSSSDIVIILEFSRRF